MISSWVKKISALLVDRKFCEETVKACYIHPHECDATFFCVGKQTSLGTSHLMESSYPSLWTPAAPEVSNALPTSDMQTIKRRYD